MFQQNFPFENILQFYIFTFQLVGENERYERQMEVLCGKQSCELMAEGDHGSTDDSKEVFESPFLLAIVLYTFKCLEN